MDFSAANTGLWSAVVQLGIISGLVLLANLMRRKLPFVRKTLMPTAVLSGFLLLALRVSGLVDIRTNMLEMITYHGIALGFIALSMRVPERGDRQSGSLAGPKTGALIASCYVVQGILGLVISLGLSYTLMPDFFKAAGILLPMGYGQGPGQANNVGTTYEALGFVGGRSFALSIAAAGFLSACVVGVIYLNVMQRRGKLRRSEAAAEDGGPVSLETFQQQDEIPISESVDKLSVQMALVLLVYLVTYLVVLGISRLTAGLGEGLAGTVSGLLWGFNFIIGSLLAMILRQVLHQLRRKKWMKRQYQNNYLLSRISGLAFDLMIIAGIASIELSDLQGLWLPFVLMSVSAAILTLVYLRWICKRLYPDYYYEGMLSMYGMMTGTISSGVLLLRELDPMFKTPASNNLLTGSSIAVLFGAPMLALIGIAPAQPLLVLGLLVVYLALLMLFLLKVSSGSKSKG